MLVSLFNKVAGPGQACNCTKKRVQHRSFLVKFAKVLRTPFLQNTSSCYFCLEVGTDFISATKLSNLPAFENSRKFKFSWQAKNRNSMMCALVYCNLNREALAHYSSTIALPACSLQKQ